MSVELKFCYHSAKLCITEHEKQLLFLHTYAVLNHILTEGDANVINLLTVTFIQIFCTISGE